MKYLKLSVVILLVTVLAVPCFAEVPKIIQYIGNLEKPNGSPYPGGIYDITFQICTDDACTTSLWSETHTVEISAKNKKDIDGGTSYEAAFSVILGSITPLDNLAFDQDYYLSISESTLGYSKIEQILTVPYSLRSDFANYAETVYNSETGEYTNLQDIVINNAYYAEEAVYAAMAGDADTVDGAHASDLEESAEIDNDIAVHAADPDAHHAKTTSFSELTDEATDGQIPDDITINKALDSDKLGGQPPGYYAPSNHSHPNTFSDNNGPGGKRRIRVCHLSGRDGNENESAADPWPLDWSFESCWTLGNNHGWYRGVVWEIYEDGTASRLYCWDRSGPCL